MKITTNEADTALHLNQSKKKYISETLPIPDFRCAKNAYRKLG